MAARSGSVLLVGLLGAGLQGQGATRAVYPEEYRTWVHTKSMVVQEGHFLYPQFGGITSWAYRPAFSSCCLR